MNEQIRIREIRLIGAEGEQLGIMSPQEGMRIAQDASMDLVEVAPNVRPPVCRIMDYSKYKYDQEKREKESRKRQHIVKLKEIRYKPRIEEHDYDTKLGRIKDFIKKGYKVKISMMFRGREMAHLEIGKVILDRVISDISDVAEPEKMPKREGRFMNMVLTPK
ncbi:MAG: translation initiation factor IF-3 [Candidatus Omnitrophota bacterium]